MYTCSYARDYGLLVGVISGTTSTDGDYLRSIQATRRLAEEGALRPDGAICILVVDPSAPRPSSNWRQRFAEETRTILTTTRRFLFVVATPSPTLRSVLTAVTWLCPPKLPHEACAVASFEEAVRWAEERRGHRLPLLQRMYEMARSEVETGPLAKLYTSVTVYLHIGGKLMPKTYPAVPHIGEIVQVQGLGRLAVIRIDYDGQGDAHIYLEHSSGLGDAM